MADKPVKARTATHQPYFIADHTPEQQAQLSGEQEYRKHEHVYAAATVVRVWTGRAEASQG